MQRSRLRGSMARLSSATVPNGDGAQPGGLRTQKTLRSWHQISQETCYVPVAHGSATANAATPALGLRLVAAARGGASREGGRGRHWRRWTGALRRFWGGAGQCPLPRASPARPVPASASLLPRSAVARRGLWVVWVVRLPAADPLVVWQCLPERTPPIRCPFAVTFGGGGRACGRVVCGCRSAAPGVLARTWATATLRSCASPAMQHHRRAVAT